MRRGPTGIKTPCSVVVHDKNPILALGACSAYEYVLSSRSSSAQPTQRAAGPPPAAERRTAPWATYERRRSWSLARHAGSRPTCSAFDLPVFVRLDPVWGRRRRPLNL